MRLSKQKQTLEISISAEKRSRPAGRVIRSIPQQAPCPAPNLAGLIGRPVAGDVAFDYSPVLKRAHAEDLIWDLQRLEAFLGDPEGMFPGMWMSYPGIRDAGERAALAGYIAVPD